MPKSSAVTKSTQRNPELEAPGKAPASAAAATGSEQHVLLVQRQESLEKPETRSVSEVRVQCSPHTSVLGALSLARQQPLSAGEQPQASIAFEGDCFEGICGGCAMLVNGRAALACGVLLSEVRDKQNRVRLAPMQAFPLVRDLVVDRSRVGRLLQGVPVPGPLSAKVKRRHAAPAATQAFEQAGLDQCHRCGACLEACPQYGAHSEFVGAATLHEVRLRNGAVLGKHGRKQRLEAMMAPGGVQSCGKAQNCVEVCPARLPLVDSIQNVARATSKRMLFGWLLK